MAKYKTGLIKAPKSGDDKFFGDVDTEGIMSVVMYADPKAGYYTKAFAKTLQGKTVLDTCRNIWEFLKTEVPYKIDEPGYQWIKSPGRLIKEGKGDCKSFSVFAASILKNLGIPYGYRFASYDPADSTPTHVYVFVPDRNGKIIVDAVWNGPFNTQKKFSHKQDFLMAKTYYLGATDTPVKHTPGVLKLTKPVDQLTEGELDLLLAKQRMEIEKMNAARVGSPYLHKYDAAISTINQALSNIDRPDVIHAIGAAMIGKAKIDPKTGKKQKTGAGKLLQKVAKGVKAGAKAVVKVATLPLRTIAKGAMEIYIPKAALFFLYLFAEESKLPDLMRRKRAKAQKLKDFIVNGLGMKEKHFMAIVRNNLTKRFGKSPESFLAEKLKTRISGLGNPKQRLRARFNGKLPTMAPHNAKRFLHPKNEAGWNSTINGIKRKAKKATSVKTAVPTVQKYQAPTLTAAKTNTALQQALQQGAQSSGNGSGLSTVVNKAASGDLIGAAISAILWLVNKIAGIGKKEKPENITASDFPDIERDAANAFEFGDLKNDYSNLSSGQQQMIKDVATDLIEGKSVKDSALELVQDRLPFLNSSQQKEIAAEVEEGPEALDSSEAAQLASQIKKDGMNKPDDINLANGGGANGGFCNC